MRILLKTGLVALLLAAPAQAALTGDYLGQKLPGAVPEVFAPGIVSTDDLQHSAPAFSPDGNEVFWRSNRRPGPNNKEWVSSTMTARRVNGVWSSPAISSLADGTPIYSLDGRRIYFSAKRTASDAQPDIWYSEKNGDGWGEPKCLCLLARYPELQAIRVEAITRSGTLYFMAHLLGPLNNGGIYRAERVNDTYAKPEALPQSINQAPFLNWTPFVAPDESYLIFSSNRRDPKHDAGDLYISRHLENGSWTDPVALGGEVNSIRQERFPRVSNDGQYLFFTRWTPDHDQDVFWVRTDGIPGFPSSKDNAR